MYCKRPFTVCKIRPAALAHLNSLPSATTATGDLMCRPNPEVTIAADAMRRALRMLSEFGLTPASRGKVSALGDETGLDPFAQMMEDMKG